MWVGLGLRVGGEMGQRGLVNGLLFNLELAEEVGVTWMYGWGPECSNHR